MNKNWTDLIILFIVRIAIQWIHLEMLTHHDTSEVNRTYPGQYLTPTVIVPVDILSLANNLQEKGTLEVFPSKPNDKQLYQVLEHIENEMLQ